MQKLFSIRGPNLQFGTFLNYVTCAPEATCFLLHFSHGVHTIPHSSLDEHNARPFTDPNEQESTSNTCYGYDPLEISHRVVARRRLHLGRGGVGRRGGSGNSVVRPRLVVLRICLLKVTTSTTSRLPKNPMKTTMAKKMGTVERKIVVHCTTYKGRQGQLS